MESNKEDTGYIVTLFADAQSEISSLKDYIVRLEASKRKLRNVRIADIALGISGIGLIAVSGFVPDDTIRRSLLAAGIAVTASAGISLGVSFAF